MDYLFGPAASADSPFRRIYVDDLDFSAEMVRTAAAWVYRKYAKEQARG
jgi:endonuclease YncB( thermonuclease family)